MKEYVAVPEKVYANTKQAAKLFAARLRLRRIAQAQGDHAEEVEWQRR